MKSIQTFNRVEIDGIKIDLHQNIDYKPMDKNKITVGVVRKLQTAAEMPESIWAEVAEVETRERDWISLSVWKEQYDAGLFKVSKQIVEPKIDDNAPSTQTDNPDDLPF